MNSLLEVSLGEGGSILIEVDEMADGSSVRGRAGATRRAAAPEQFEQLLAGLGPVARAVLGQLRAATDAPHEIQVEFAVKLSADANLIVARAGSEGNFRIVLTWSRGVDAVEQER